MYNLDTACPPDKSRYFVSKQKIISLDKYTDSAYNEHCSLCEEVIVHEHSHYFKEAILDISRQLVREKGLGAVNIRTIAAACGVSVGSIYNYFCSKSDLVMATIESIWQDIFHDSKQDSEFLDFTECIQWIFDCLKAGSEKYPGFFTSHSISLLGKKKQTAKSE